MLENHPGGGSALSMGDQGHELCSTRALSCHVTVEGPPPRPDTRGSLRQDGHGAGGRVRHHPAPHWHSPGPPSPAPRGRLRGCPSGTADLQCPVAHRRPLIHSFGPYKSGSTGRHGGGRLCPRSWSPQSCLHGASFLYLLQLQDLREEGSGEREPRRLRTASQWGVGCWSSFWREPGMVGGVEPCGESLRGLLWRRLDKLRWPGLTWSCWGVRGASMWATASGLRPVGSGPRVGGGWPSPHSPSPAGLCPSAQVSTLLQSKQTPTGQPRYKG